MELTPNRTNEELRLPLAEVRKDLLDFGLRNPLLNYRLLKTRELKLNRNRNQLPKNNCATAAIARLIFSLPALVGIK